MTRPREEDNERDDDEGRERDGAPSGERTDAHLDEDHGGEDHGDDDHPEHAPPAGGPPAKVVGPPKPPTLRRFFTWVKDHYLEVDLRTLGLFRIALGSLLALNVLRVWSEARWLYSNEGVVSNHLMLFRAPGDWHFSALLAFSSMGEVHVAFALMLTCHVALALGYRTRLAHLLSFVSVTSLGSRLVLVENGGYIVLNLVTMWSLFLPLGERFSVDAWRRSLRSWRPTSIAELNDRELPFRATRPTYSVAYACLLANFALIYLLNSVNKTGSIWHAGDTVHYVLHLDRMITGWAVWWREHLPGWAGKLLSWSVLVVESVIAALIVAPKGKRVTRPLAMALLWPLHMSFGVLMRLGPFSWGMITWSFLLPTREAWTAAEEWFRRVSKPVVVTLADRPLAWSLARLVGRLDRLAQVRFEVEAPANAESRTSAPLWTVRLEGAAEPLKGGAAVRAVAHALPAGRLLYPLVFVLSLGLVSQSLRVLARAEGTLSRFFALPSARRIQPEPEPMPLAETLALWTARARDAFVLFLAVGAGLQAWAEGKGLPPKLQIELPRPWHPFIHTARLYQGWGMFAANPIVDDGTLVVEAWTIDGRRIDPLNGGEPDLDLTDARGLGHSQLRQDYGNRIRQDRNRPFRDGLRDYLLRHHERTGSPSDELAGFDVYWVRDLCPPPGSNQPYANEKVPLLTWRKPKYTPPQGVAPLPREPRVRSAESNYDDSTWVPPKDS